MKQKEKTIAYTVTATPVYTITIYMFNTRLDQYRTYRCFTQVFAHRFLELSQHIPSKLEITSFEKQILNTKQSIDYFYIIVTLKLKAFHFPLHSGHGTFREGNEYPHTTFPFRQRVNFARRQKHT